MDLKYLLATTTGRLILFFSKGLNKGGTALPGLIAKKLDDNVLTKLIKRPRKATIIITGTNGKTTTSHLITAILRDNGYNLIHNTAGSNLERGIISSLLKNKQKFPVDFYVFETDEADFNNVAKKLKPDVVIFNNLFRDQLDRYGEVETVRQRWIETLSSLSSQTRFILNADDPGVSSIAYYIKDRSNIFYFGSCSIHSKTPPFPKYYAGDFERCPFCNQKLVFTKRSFSHLGDYYCKNCGFKRPKTNLCFQVKKNSLIIKYDSQALELTPKLKGLYNAYNIASSLTILLSLKMGLDKAKLGIESFRPAFGRQEKVLFKGKTLIISLVKNPTGFSETLKTYADEIKDAAIILNDNIADSEDVSWIWDADLNALNKAGKIILGGTRAYDMGLRLKYEGVEIKKITFAKNISNLLTEITQLKNNTIHIFPTYTALLELEKQLVKFGYKKSWKK